jgi:GWxTD domain-containing protein
MPHLKNVASVALLALLVAADASAALSKKYTEWARGPVQWIMTKAEKSAWKQVKSDEEAIRFIDLFWVRRDPSPGTPENEARNEYAGREAYADEQFSEQKPYLRGALTDRGRALYVLGAPPNLGSITSSIADREIPKMEAPSMGGGRSAAPPAGIGGGPGPSAARQLGAKEEWIWERDAARKFDMPRVEVVFVTDPIGKRTHRDLSRRDYAAAEAMMLRKQIVAEYSSLPEWAAFGGLEPKARGVKIVRTPAAVPPPAPAAPPPVVVPAEPVAAMPRGVSRLTFLTDPYSIDANTPADPFLTLKAVDAFARAKELGWVAQYCTGTEQENPVPFMLRITGTAAGGKKVERISPLDDLLPDRLRSLPGCAMLRGALPLEDFAPGRYTLELMIEDPALNGATLKRDFTVE